MKRVLLFSAYIVFSISAAFAQIDSSNTGKITTSLTAPTFVADSTENADSTVAAADSIPATPQANGPFISFVTKSHDFGKVIFAQEVKFDFQFTNTGNAPLTISSVKTTCGCTTPQWPKEPIAPNQTAVITVRYDSYRSGEFAKGITVYSNAVNGDAVLLIEGEVTTNPNKAILGGNNN